MVCVCLCMYVLDYARHVLLCVRIWIYDVFVYVRVYVWEYVEGDLCMYVCMYVCVYVDIRRIDYVCTRVRV